MIDPKRAHSGTYVMAVLLFLGGATLLGYTVAMNYVFAQTVALTEGGKLLRSGSSIAMDVFGALLMMAAGFAWTAGSRALGVATLVTGIMFVSYSGWNLVGFGASERLGAEYHRTKVEKANDKRQKENLELRKDQAKWLRDTAVNDAKGAERKRLIEEASAQIDKAIQAPVEVVKDLPPDAQAELASEITGANVSKVQKFDTIVFAVLLITGKAVGFFFAPLFLPRRVIGVAKSAAVQSGDEAGEAKTNGPLAPEEEKIARDERRRRLVQRFLDECVVDQTGAKILASDLLSAYQEWARRNGEVEMTQNAFGRICGSMNLARRSNGANMVYTDMALVPKSGLRVVRAA